MGAETFYNTSHGDTPKEAFKSAVDHALHEYGHGGYSGSIAEKGSFVIIKPTDTEKKHAEKQILDGIHTERVSLIESLKVLEEALANNRPAGITKQGYTLPVTQIARIQQDILKYENTIKSIGDKTYNFDIVAERLASMYIDKSDPRIDDKWGPAGCIEIRPPKISQIKRISPEKLCNIIKEQFPKEEILLEIKKPDSYYTVKVFNKKNHVVMASYLGKTLSEIANKLQSKTGKYLFFGWASS